MNHLGFLSLETLKDFHPVEDNPRFRRALKDLDKISGRQVLKVGCVYVAEGQEDQKAIFRNDAGSFEFNEFLKGLGWNVALNTHPGFLGGLDSYGSTGKTAPYYANSSYEMIFHVSTRIPTLESDPQQIQKKRHIGNDIVHIIWSEHKRDYNPSTITSQFNDAHVVIYPLPNGLFRIQIHRKEKLSLFGPLLDEMVINKQMLPFLVRQTTINANRLVRFNTKGYKRPFSAREDSINEIVKRYQLEQSFDDFMSSMYPLKGDNSWKLSHEDGQKISADTEEEETISDSNSEDQNKAHLASKQSLTSSMPAGTSQTQTFSKQTSAPFVRSSLESSSLSQQQSQQQPSYQHQQQQQQQQQQSVPPPRPAQSTAGQTYQQQQQQQPKQQQPSYQQQQQPPEQQQQQPVPPPRPAQSTAGQTYQPSSSSSLTPQPAPQKPTYQPPPSPHAQTQSQSYQPSPSVPVRSQPVAETKSGNTGAATVSHSSSNDGEKEEEKKKKKGFSISLFGKKDKKGEEQPQPQIQPQPPPPAQPQQTNPPDTTDHDRKPVGGVTMGNAVLQELAVKRASSSTPTSSPSSLPSQASSQQQVPPPRPVRPSPSSGPSYVSPSGGPSPNNGPAMPLGPLRPIPSSQTSPRPSPSGISVSQMQSPVPMTSSQKFYTLEQLKTQRDTLQLDTTRLESYLSDEDFLNIMGSDRETFYKMPAWKQNSKKKSLGLV